jgi:hypothetical protein
MRLWYRFFYIKKNILSGLEFIGHKKIEFSESFLVTSWKGVKKTSRLVAQRSWQGFPASTSWVQASACMPVTPAVPYLPTGLAGCSVGLRISRGACKLARTPWVIKKNKKTGVVSSVWFFSRKDPLIAKLSDIKLMALNSV